MFSLLFLLSPLEMGGEYRVVIKGSANDEAVLCTESKTFALKNLEISNTVLLLDAEADLSSSSAEVRVTSWRDFSVMTCHSPLFLSW